MHSLDLTLIDTTKSIGDEQRKLMRAAHWDASDYTDIAAEQWENGPADMASDMLSDFSDEARPSS